MSDGGFFLMHRGWRDNPVFRGEFSRADAWVWLIENACWKPTRFDIKGKSVTLQRGQICASRERLADAWGWSPSAVERYLTRLKTEQMIGRETGQGKSVITICNYDKYQAKADEAGQEIEQSAGQTSDRHRTAKEQGNKGTTKEEKAKASSSKRERSFAGWPDLPDWLPAEPWASFLDVRWQKRAWPTARAVSLLIAELDGWRAKGHDPGKVLNNSTMNNWTGLFEPKDPQNGNHPHRNSAPIDRRDGIAQALDRRLGLDEPPGQAGRSDLGQGQGDSDRAPPRLAILR